MAATLTTYYCINNSGVFRYFSSYGVADGAMLMDYYVVIVFFRISHTFILISLLVHYFQLINRIYLAISLISIVFYFIIVVYLKRLKRKEVQTYLHQVNRTLSIQIGIAIVFSAVSNNGIKNNVRHYRCKVLCVNYHST